MSRELAVARELGVMVVSGLMPRFYCVVKSELMTEQWQHCPRQQNDGFDPSHITGVDDDERDFTHGYIALEKNQEDSDDEGG